MLLEIIMTINVFFLLIYVVFVVKYPFWSKQPVFHYWNLKQWLRPSGIIKHAIPGEKNRYFDRNIAFNEIGNLSPAIISDFCQLVNNHFMRSREVDFSPTPNNILAHFKHHSIPSNIVYSYSEDNSTMIGALTGRPLYCFFNNIDHFTKTGKLESTKITLNYVDYLCVHKDHRKRNLAPKLIYTYYVRQRQSNHDTSVFLFKREGDSHFIVPLCVYMTYGFSLDKLFYNVRMKQKNYVLPPLTSMLQFDQKSATIISEYENTIKSAFNCVIFPAINNIVRMITDNVFQIYAIMSKDKAMLALYIFKDTETTFDGNKSLDCIASFNNTDETTFINGFFNVLATKISVQTLVIENISHNETLIKAISQLIDPQFHSKTSYYFYNYASHPFYSKEVFICA